MSTPSFNPENEIGDGMLYEEEYGVNPVVISDDSVSQWRKHSMPHKHDTQPYSWPKSQDLKYFKSIVTTFPNGTVLTCYEQSLLKHSLDKLTKSDVKQKKHDCEKWETVS